MARPNIQIDDLVREMTEEEYAELLASGWTEESIVVAEEPVDEPIEGEQP
jgi:hypothetical protein